jgi:hypothetical protein
MFSTEPEVGRTVKSGLKITNPIPAGDMVLFFHGIRVRSEPEANSETYIPPWRKPN